MAGPRFLKSTCINLDSMIQYPGCSGVPVAVAVLALQWTPSGECSVRRERASAGRSEGPGPAESSSQLK